MLWSLVRRLAAGHILSLTSRRHAQAPNRCVVILRIVGIGRSGPPSSPGRQRQTHLTLARSAPPRGQNPACLPEPLLTLSTSLSVFRQRQGAAVAVRCVIRDSAHRSARGLIPHRWHAPTLGCARGGRRRSRATVARRCAWQHLRIASPARRFLCAGADESDAETRADRGFSDVTEDLPQPRDQTAGHAENGSPVWADRWRRRRRRVVIKPEQRPVRGVRCCRQVRATTDGRTAAIPTGLATSHRPLPSPHPTTGKRTIRFTEIGYQPPRSPSPPQRSLPGRALRPGHQRAPPTRSTFGVVAHLLRDTTPPGNARRSSAIPARNPRSAPALTCHMGMRHSRPSLRPTRSPSRRRSSTAWLDTPSSSATSDLDNDALSSRSRRATKSPFKPCRAADRSSAAEGPAPHSDSSRASAV